VNPESRDSGSPLRAVRNDGACGEISNASANPV
jgi:hypothetical protein